MITFNGVIENNIYLLRTSILCKTKYSFRGAASEIKHSFTMIVTRPLSRAYLFSIERPCSTNSDTLTSRSCRRWFCQQ